MECLLSLILLNFYILAYFLEREILEGGPQIYTILSCAAIRTQMVGRRHIGQADRFPI